MENKLIGEGNKVVLNALEDRRDGIDEEIANAKEIIKRKKINMIINLVLNFLEIILAVGVTSLLAGSRMSLLTGLDNSVLWGLLTNMNGYTFFSIVYGVSFSLINGLFTLPHILTYRKEKRRLKGFNNELNELEKILNIEKQKLEKNKGLEQVDIDEVVKGLLNMLTLYYDCGFNEEKWSRDYTSGKLSKKLLKQGYDFGEIAQVENYFKDKESINVKKRTRRSR